MKRILITFTFILALLSLRYMDNLNTIEIGLFLIGCSLLTLFLALIINSLKYLK